VVSYRYHRYESGASPIDLPLRFPGQYRDRETGLFENWNRYYEPESGRYLQPEPLAREDPSAATSKPYTYANLNPNLYADPSGEYVLKDKCPLWNVAVTTALSWAGCQPNGQQRNCKCQEKINSCAAGCNICEILRDGKGPPTFVDDLADRPAGAKGMTRLHSYFQVSGLVKITAEKVRIKKRYCYSPSMVTTLAEVLIHEAAHVCSEQITKQIRDKGKCNAHEITAQCVPF